MKERRKRAKKQGDKKSREMKARKVVKKDGKTRKLKWWKETKEQRSKVRKKKEKKKITAEKNERKRIKTEEKNTFTGAWSTWTYRAFLSFPLNDTTGNSEAPELSEGGKNRGEKLLSDWKKKTKKKQQEYKRRDSKGELAKLWSTFVNIDI